MTDTWVHSIGSHDATCNEHTSQSEALITRVIEPLQKSAPMPLHILVIEAGNDWLSIQLRECRYIVAAVDVNPDGRDGLYQPGVAPGQFDIAIVNLVSNYPPDFERVINKVLRTLKPTGVAVILDSINRFTERKIKECERSLGVGIRLLRPAQDEKRFAHQEKTSTPLQRGTVQFSLALIYPHPIWSPSPVRRMVRRLAERLLHFRYMLIDQPRGRRPYQTLVAGRVMQVFPQVFDPHLFETGEFLARTLDSQLIPPGCNVLDMGTGTGVGAIAAAQWAGRVIAIDINPAAVACAQANTSAMGLDRIDIRQGDLFEPVNDERFDVVLFNPPYFHGVPHTPFEMAFVSTDMAQRFASELEHHLEPSGCALLLLSDRGEMAAFVYELRIRGYTLQVAAEQVTLTERITLFKVAPPHMAYGNERKSEQRVSAVPEAVL